ncbi:MAG: ATP-binding protein [Planctomycetota bacterium]|jgi:hypothetical protein|nr:ATP-binding protein [Planctomycetota bacterium]
MSAIAKQPLKTLPGVITRGRHLPPHLCIFGVPGIGKSTFAAGAPNPVFIPTEPGVENLDIPQFPLAKTLPEFLANLEAVAKRDHGYGAVAIDTINALMELYYQAKKDIPGEKGRPLYEFKAFGGFGGWKGVSRDIHAEVLPLLTQCKERGMFVILLAHTGDYTRKNPLGDDLTVAAPSIPKWVWAELHGYLDVIGRADYVYTTKQRDGGRAKASTDVESVNGVRVKVRQLTFDGGVEQDCKTRVGYELPPTMPLSWEAFEAALGNVNALAAEVFDLWQYLPPEKEQATLAWLGVSQPSPSLFADAGRKNRGKLSQLRNRLLEMKAMREAEEAATAAENIENEKPEPKPAA